MDYEWLAKRAQKFNPKFDFNSREDYKFPPTIRSQLHEKLKNAYTIHGDKNGRTLLICMSVSLGAGVIITKHIKDYYDAMEGQKEVALVNLNSKNVLWMGNPIDLPVVPLRVDLPYGPGFIYDPEHFAKALPELPAAQNGQSAPVVVESVFPRRLSIEDLARKFQKQSWSSLTRTEMMRLTKGYPITFTYENGEEFIQQEADFLVH